MSWKEVELTKVHRLFYPQVPVILTAEFEERVGGMPAIWCMPLSFSPPLVGVAVSLAHETYKMILGARAFGLNWLSFSYAEQIGELGEVSGGRSDNKLSEIGFTAIKGENTAQPILTEALAVMECVLRERYRTGTHELIIGEVVRAAATDGFKDYWDFSAYDPLLYAGTVTEGGRKWIFMSRRGDVVKVPFKLQT